MFPRLLLEPTCRKHTAALERHNNEHYSAVKEAGSFEGTLPRCVLLRLGRCLPLSAAPPGMWTANSVCADFLLVEDAAGAVPVASGSDSRESAKLSLTFPIFPYSSGLPIADDSQSPLLRSHYAVTDQIRTPVF